MNKRGTGLLDKLSFTLFELIAIGMVFVLVMYAVISIANDTTFWKRYYSTDVGLILDIENINQGDYNINYKLLERNGTFMSRYTANKTFEFQLTNTSIIVYDHPKKEDKKFATVPYSKNKNINSENSTVHSQFLTIVKKGDVLKISTNNEVSKECPSQNTFKELGGLTNFSSIKLSAESEIFSKSFNELSKDYGQFSDSSMELTILFDYEEKSNTTIYYFSDQNKIRQEKLSCLIKRDLSENNNIVEFKEYDDYLSSEKKEILDMYITEKSSDEIIILIKVNNKDAQNPNEFIQKIWKTIVQKYYENN